MLISNSATDLLFVADNKKQLGRLQTSMAKLSSGERFILPGEAPADLGISELFAAQQRNSKEASFVIQNATNMFTSSDGWLQQVHDILGRMSELAISSYDGSKRQDDRLNLDLEFQQLKEEVARIAVAGKFNGRNINSNIAPATYNSKSKTITYSQSDGTETTNLNINLAPGNSSANGMKYEFVDQSNGGVGSFLFSRTGKELLYVTQPKLSQSQDTASLTSSLVDLDSVDWSTADDIKLSGVNVSLDNVKALGTSIQSNTQANLNDLVSAFQKDIDSLDNLAYKYKVSGSLDSSGNGVNLTITSGNSGTDAFLSTENGDTNSNGLDFLGFTDGSSDGGTLSLKVAENLSDGDEIEVYTIDNGTKTSHKLTAGSDFNIGDNETDTAANIASAFSLISGISATSNGSNVIISEDGGPSGTFNVIAGMVQKINKLDVKEDIITSVSLDSPQGDFSTKLKMDEKGNVWTLNPTSDGTFKLAKVDVRDLSIDEGGSGDTNTWAGSVTVNSNFTDFAVHDDSVYYVNSKNEFVRRGLYDATNEEVLVPNMMETAGLNPYFNGNDTWSVSQDGYYIAWRDYDDVNDTTQLKVLNTQSLKTSSRQVGTTKENIAAIEFDANNNIYWTDTGSVSSGNSLYRAQVAFSDIPTINNVSTIRTGNLGELGGATSQAVANGNGLSVQGGSPGTIFDFIVGPDENMVIETVTGKVDLVTLGLSRLSVDTALSAKKSIESIQGAISLVARQRALIGSQVSRLGFTYNANETAMNNIAQARSRIRDVDFAEESANIANAQVASQSANQVLTISNGMKRNILSLLQSL